jgi:hypothetical protein
MSKLHGLPIGMFLELIINRGERIAEFLLSLAFEDPLEGRGGGLGRKQTKVCRRERLGCHVDGFCVQSNLIDHVCVENDSSVLNETFPDHPSKCDASETVTCAVLHRSTPDI